MLNQGKKLLRICEMQEGEGIECKKKKKNENVGWMNGRNGKNWNAVELDKQMRERDRETGGENRD